MTTTRPAWLALGFAAGCLACQGSPTGGGAGGGKVYEAHKPPSDDGLPPAPEATPLPPGLAPFVEPWKGDLDGMVKRRVIRVLTVQNPILYCVDRGREMGVTYEAIKAFEKRLNKTLGKTVVAVHVIAIPVARDQLIPRLL